MPVKTTGRAVTLLVTAGLLAGGCGHVRGRGGTEASMAQVKVEQVSFHGWNDAWRVSNPVCELVVVPSLSRVMAFGWRGGTNLLWLSPNANGQTYPVDDMKWHNLGGDKVWPAEQTRWKEYTGRDNWPPPHAFDSGVGRVERIPGGVRLTTPRDPDFGTVCTREFILDRAEPLVHVRQVFGKTEGPAQEMTLWTITQVSAPTMALLPTGASADGRGYQVLSDGYFAGALAGGTLALRNCPELSQKAGVPPNAARNNGWVAATFAAQSTLLVESHRLESDGRYPDGDCQAELYADNGVNGSYVEMELLSPLRAMRAGSRLAHDEVWQLVRLPAGVADDAARAGALARQAHAAALERLAR